MERNKQYTAQLNEENWTEQQEKEYWNELNKKRINKENEEQIAIAYLQHVSPMDLIYIIAAAKGYNGSDIYKDIEHAALDAETALNRFLKEVEDLNASLLIMETLAKEI